MPGMGTLLNACAVAVAGVLGVLFRRILKPQYQDSIIKASGVSVIFLGAAGTLSKMLTLNASGTALEVTGALLMNLSLILGALVGEIVDIDKGFVHFGVWLSEKPAAPRTRTLSTPSSPHP